MKKIVFTHLKKFIGCTLLILFIITTPLLSMHAFSFNILVNPVDNHFAFKKKLVSRIFHDAIISHLYFEGIDVKLPSPQAKPNKDVHYILNSRLDYYAHELTLSIQIIDALKRNSILLDKETMLFESEMQKNHFPFQISTESQLISKDIKKITPKIFSLINRIMSRLLKFTQEKKQLPKVYIQDDAKVLQSIDEVQQFSKDLLNRSKKTSLNQIELIFLIDSNPKMHAEINALYNQLDRIIKQIHLVRPEMIIRIGLVHMNENSVLKMTTQLSKVKSKLDLWTSNLTQPIRFEQMIQALQKSIFSLDISHIKSIPKVVLMLTNKSMNSAAKVYLDQKNFSNIYDDNLSITIPDILFKKDRSNQRSYHHTDENIIKMGILPLKSTQNSPLISSLDDSTEDNTIQKNWPLIQYSFYYKLLKETTHVKAPIIIDHLAQQHIENTYFNQLNRYNPITTHLVQSLKNKFNIQYVLSSTLNKEEHGYKVHFWVKKIVHGNKLATVLERKYIVSGLNDIAKIISQLTDEVWYLHKNQLRPKNALLKIIQLMRNLGSSLYVIGSSGIDLKTAEIFKTLCHRTKGKYLQTSYEYALYMKHIDKQSHFIYHNYQLYFKTDPNFSMQRRIQIDNTKVYNMLPKNYFNNVEEAKKFVLQRYQSNTEGYSQSNLHLSASNFSYLIEQVIQNSIPKHEEKPYRLQLNIQGYHFNLDIDLDAKQYDFIQQAIKNKMPFFIAAPIVPTSTYKTQQTSNIQPLSFKMPPNKIIFIAYSEKKYLSPFFMPKLAHIKRYAQAYSESGIGLNRYWLFKAFALDLAHLHPS